MPETFHCQICGRAIKAKTGLIAHHGYQRPGQGWQTRSCFGARFRPYEVAHDALDACIPRQEEYLANLEQAQVTWVASPPETITRHGERMRMPYRPPIVYQRPGGFDPEAALKRAGWMRNTYEAEWLYSHQTRRQAIKQAKETLEFLRARRSAWKEAA